MCPRDFLGELDYWGLSALHLGEKKHFYHIIIVYSTFNFKAVCQSLKV